MLSLRWLTLYAVVALLPWVLGPAAAQQIYKWTDESGRVHYGAKKPENAPQAHELDIATPSPAPSSPTDSSAEIARIRALSEQMASERQALEQARREQALHELERENQRLQKELLTRQLQQEQEAKPPENEVILYPPTYAYPPVYPPPSYPPPCEPWPNCRRPPPPPVQPPRPPAVKPHPPFNPKPVGVDTKPRGAFW
ncbi:MAG: DUF4124 domain-containing protein [Candidatus Competibacteraceae bacterium]|nr:DUF4124 domain-containing protein [Candidatus Competibacteraceae bacterium]